MKAKIAALVSSVFVAVFFLSISIFALLILLFYVVMDNYNYCTFAFKSECENPDAVYLNDPISDTEIVTLARDMIKARMNLVEYTPEDFQVYLPEIPILDMERVLEINKENRRNAELSKKEETELEINEDGDSDPEPMEPSGGYYKVTDLPANNETLKATIEKELLRDIPGNVYKTIPGIADAFINAGFENNIDPRFLVAVTIQETGYGTSNRISNQKNIAGITCVTKPIYVQKFNITGCHSGFSTFLTIQDSLRYQADLLNRLYTSQGLLTVPDIGAQYAPVGAANDPTGLNKNWVPNVSSKLGNMGVANVGMGYPGVITGHFGKIVPDFNKYTPFSKNLFWKRGDKVGYEIKDYSPFFNNEEERREFDGDIDTMLEYIAENNSNNVVLDDSYLNEAEMQLRTIKQFDLDGTAGIRARDYQIAYALLRAKRQMSDNPQKYNLESLSLTNERKSFVDWFTAEKFSDPKVGTVEDNIVDYMENRLNTRKLEMIDKAAKSGVYYPLLWYVLEEDPIDINNFEAKVESAYEKHLDDANIVESLLSGLTIGYYLKDDAIKTFRKDYAWIAWDSESFTENFKEHVEGQRDKAGNKRSIPDEYEDLSWYEKLFEDLKAFVNPKTHLKRLTNRYFDMAITYNPLVRFAMYSEAREVMEIGSYAKINCFYLEPYGYDGETDYCMRINEVALPSAVLKWEHSQVLNKTKYEKYTNKYCLPPPPDSASNHNINFDSTLLNQPTAVAGWFGDIKDFFSDDRERKPLDIYNEEEQEQLEKDGWSMVRDEGRYSGVVVGKEIHRPRNEYEKVWVEIDENEEKRIYIEPDPVCEYGIGSETSESVKPYYYSVSELFEQTRHYSYYWTQQKTDDRVKFKNDVLANYKSQTNVEFIRYDDEFLEKFEDYLLNRPANIGVNNASGGGMSASGPATGSHVNVDSKVFEGLTFSIPIPFNPGQKVTITSGYGQRSGRLHTGLDFQGPNGSWTDIISAADGEVVLVNHEGADRSWGLHVIIWHPKPCNPYEDYESYKGDTWEERCREWQLQTQKIYTQYAHLKDGTVSVKVGDKVRRGQVIGHMGATGAVGKSSRPGSGGRAIHLHFNVLVGGTVAKTNSTDPAPVIGVNNSNSWCSDRRDNCPLN